MDHSHKYPRYPLEPSPLNARGSGDTLNAALDLAFEYKAPDEFSFQGIGSSETL
jgi:hypothetical protein